MSSQLEDAERALSAPPEDGDAPTAQELQALYGDHQHDSDALERMRTRIQALRVAVDESRASGETGTAERLEQRAERHIASLRSIATYFESLDARRVAGYPLNETQRLALVGLKTWLRESIGEAELFAHLVKPMGTGKTLTALALGEAVGGRWVYLADTGNNAAQALAAFKAHVAREDSTPRTIGQCFNGVFAPAADIVVGTLASAEPWWNEVPWGDVRLLVVDEADVNAMSAKRQARIKETASSFGIPVVAMSATEQQSSGKNLRTAYPHELLRLSLPTALRDCLQLGLIPQLQFYDLRLDLDLEVDDEEVVRTGDISSERVQTFTRSNAWNEQLLDHYAETYAKPTGGFEPGLVIFRDNIGAEDFVAHAAQRGIRAAAFTGDLPDEQQKALREDLASGKVDLLVGSRLLGRGFDVPEITVVFNSLVTYSPQMFWQASGRAMRRDPARPDKVGKVVCVLPRRTYRSTNRAVVSGPLEPLSHANFFDPDFYASYEERRDREGGGRPRMHDPARKRAFTVFDLARVQTTRSLTEVATITSAFWKYGKSFTARPDALASLVREMEATELTFPAIYRILMLRNSAELLARAEALRDEVSVKVHAQIDLARWRDGSTEPLTRQEERAQLRRVKLGADSSNAHLREDADAASRALLQAHLGLLESLASAMAVPGIDAEDLLQEACIAFFHALPKYQLDSRMRLSTFVLLEARRHLERYVANNASTIRIPPHAREKIRKVEAAAQALSEASPEARVSEQAIAEATGLSQRVVKSTREIGTPTFVPIEALDNEPLSVHAELHRDGSEIEQRIIDAQRQEGVNEMLGTLNRQDQKVCKMRFGWNNDTALSAREVGADLNLTSSRILQIENRYLRKMRVPYRVRILQGHMEQQQRWGGPQAVLRKMTDEELAADAQRDLARLAAHEASQNTREELGMVLRELAVRADRKKRRLAPAIREWLLRGNDETLIHAVNHAELTKRFFPLEALEEAVRNRVLALAEPGCTPNRRATLLRSLRACDKALRQEGSSLKELVRKWLDLSSDSTLVDAIENSAVLTSGEVLRRTPASRQGG